MTVLIIGAGIAGLTTALSLHQIGIEARVFESVDTIEPLGVGINILPHAVRELTELGLADQLAATAVPNAELAYYSKHGQLIWSEPRGLAAGYNWPQFSIHRGELQMILLEAARDRLGADHILTGHHLVHWETTATSVRAFFDDRRRDIHVGEVEGELLIAADGIHSVARGILYPKEGQPIWNGSIMWRSISHAKPFLSGRTMIAAGDGSQRFICYPISRAEMERGEALLNWIAVREFQPDHQWRREDWNRPGHLADFLPHFSSWRYDWLDVPGLIGAAAGCHEYPMVDRNPLERWSFGRVTLLGDAAHPMYPVGSNGASQGILDARVLAREIRAQGPTEAALRAYEAERHPTTAAIVLANRKDGPARVMQLVEERAPNGFTRIEDVLTEQELEETAANYKRIAGFDKDALNNRPSIVTI